MGDAAPKFGSSKKLSTMAGFAVGTWNGLVRIKLVWGAAIDTHYLLVLKPNGSAELSAMSAPETIAHGTWAAEGERVALNFADVGGLSFDEVEAQYRKRLDEMVAARRKPFRIRYPWKGSHGLGVAGERHHLVSLSRAMPFLRVTADGKSLEPIFRNEEFARQTGSFTWSRTRD